ncbi:30S ribosomal protein S4 [Patescibacteria group bacterium]
MARQTGPTQKLSRRAGVDLGHKTNSMKVARRLNIPPGSHGRKGGKKLSDFGIQLKEKQKVKWAYGVLEKQFKKYYEKATKNPEATGEELLKLLENRLDNVVFRLNFAPTRRSARQLVSHGHIKIDGKKVDIPSYQVKIGETISLSDKAQKIPASAELLAEAKLTPPSWLEKKAAVGRVKARPDREHIDLEINEQLIVEYYSR